MKILKHDDGRGRQGSHEVHVDLDFMGDVSGYGETGDHAAAHTVMELVDVLSDIKAAINELLRPASGNCFLIGFLGPEGFVFRGVDDVEYQFFPDKIATTTPEAAQAACKPVPYGVVSEFVVSKAEALFIASKKYRP